MYSSSIIERRLFAAKKAGLVFNRIPRDQSIDVAARLERLRFGRDNKPLPDGQLARPINDAEQRHIESERILCKFDFEYWYTRYCNPPEAPIWMWDGSYCPLGEVKIGDKVVGWNKSSTQITKGATQHRIPLKEKFCQSEVLAIKRRMAPLIHVYLESGNKITCTPDHLWSNGAEYKSSVPWVQAEEGIILRRFCNPSGYQHRLLTEHEAGWLSGIIDGEGTVRPSLVSIAQSVNCNQEVFAEIYRILEKLGLPFQISHDKFNVSGGREMLSLLLNICKPVKVDRFYKALYGFCHARKDRIIHIECGSRSSEVISMQTTTGNYVAWGYASKNCMIERDPGVGELSGIGPPVLTESQRRYITLIGRREEECFLEQKKYKFTEGILAYFHKVRQVNATATARGFTSHRMIFWPGTRAFAASLDDDRIGELFKRDHLALDNLPFWMKPRIYPDVKDKELGFEAPISSRISYQAENAQTGIGTGSQVDVSHLTEVALWQYPGRIRYSFVPSIPKAITTLHIQESTADGKGNYWHEVTEAARHKRRGYESWIYAFIPWYMNRLKYRAIPPDDWTPEEHTLRHIELIERTSPEFFDGITQRPTREQTFWWEKTRAQHAQNGELATFLTNFPATPEQSFQSPNAGALPVELIERMETRTRMPDGRFDVEIAA